MNLDCTWLMYRIVLLVEFYQCGINYIYAHKQVNSENFSRNAHQVQKMPTGFFQESTKHVSQVAKGSIYLFIYGYSEGHCDVLTRIYHI